MIVREHPTAYVMIEQAEHAYMSGQMVSLWKNSLFLGKTYRPSVEYAIEKHDDGWKAIDQQPFWNDEKQVPYSFIDFPTIPKTIFYKHGIDEVERVDAYSGLLCSRHYVRFLKGNPSDEVKNFLQQETKRQQQIVEAIPSFNHEWFDFHYGLLQFCDDLSLYVCMHEPGASQTEIHHFFRDGITLHPSLDMFKRHRLTLHWKDKKTIVIDAFPFKQPVQLTIPQKIVQKDDIAKHGLVKAYENTPTQYMQVTLRSTSAIGE